MGGRPFLSILAVALAALVLSATIAAPPALASEEPADASEPTTITTVLHPGWNMVGWVGPETPAPEISFPHETDGHDRPLLVFLGDVPAETEAAIRTEFDHVRTFFEDHFEAGTADYTLYVGADKDAVAETYLQAFGPDVPERLCVQWSGNVAIINLGCGARTPYGLDAIHVSAVVDNLAPSTSLPSVPAGFDARGPHWFRNGAALYVRDVYRVANGHRVPGTTRRDLALRAERASQLLSGASTLAGFHENYSESQALGFLAAEWLADRAGDPAIFDYYRLLPDSESWEEAFEATFSITVDDFYEQFEAYRAEVASLAGASEPTTVTTVLHPGWNMVGWVGPETTASELFDEIPALTGIYAWDREAGGYRHRARPIVHLLDPLMLTPGRGLWLHLDGDAPFEWTREASAHSVLLELQAGRNLVAWAGRDGTPIEEAVVRFGDRLMRAWRWDAEAARYLLYHPHAASNSLSELNHGDALLVELTEGTRWWQSGVVPPVVFLGEFTEDERAEIVGWVDGTRALFGERWGVEGPATTTYVGDREAVAPTYRTVRGRNDVTSCGDYGGWVIFLIDGCVNGGAHAHEYFHALQGHLMAWSGKRVPGWMVEGSASYALILYRGTVSTTQTGDERIQEARHQDAVFLRRHKLLTLSDLEDYSATVEPGNHGYTLGFLAVAWLAERAGEQSIIDFFVRLADEPGWHEAFEGAFSLSVDDFYELFAAYLAEVAAPLPHVTDDSPDPALMFVGDVPADTRKAVREEFERIQAFFVEELGAGTADYTMLVAADEASAETAHRLVLSTEYSGRCSNVLYGVAGIVNLGCRSTGPEYGLVYQHYQGVKNQLALSGSLPRSPDGRRTSGPAWLVRGASTYVKYRYLDMAAHEDYGSLRATEVLRSTGITLPLADMEAYEGFSGLRAAVGFLASEWLLERTGDTALFEYYRLLDGSETWEEAFEAAFGIAIDDFYEEFEAYRARVAPPIEGADSS